MNYEGYYTHIKTKIEPMTIIMPTIIVLSCLVFSWWSQHLMSAHLTKAGRKLRWCHATRREWKKNVRRQIYNVLKTSLNIILKQTIEIELVISNITFSRDSKLPYLISHICLIQKQIQRTTEWEVSRLVYLFPSRRQSFSSFKFPLPAPQNLSFSNRLSKTDEAYPFLTQWRHFSPRSKEARRHGHSSFQSLIKQNDPSKNNMANFRLRNSHQTN